MGLHGGGVAGAASPGGGVMATHATPPAPQLAGFRHMFGDPSAPALDEGVLRRRMAALAWRMVSRRGEASAPGKLPAGYTYVLQLLAHDLVASAMPIWGLGGATQDLRNLRTERLRLETLYGGGPAACPFAYASDRPDRPGAARFRLGRIVPEPRASAPDGAPVRGSAFRDIPRARLEAQHEGHGRASSVPLVADVRNDDHPILSQLAALFLTLHNRILDRLGPVPAQPLRPRTQQAEARFRCAQAATALVWRRIIRDDLLPKLLHREVLALYGTAKPAFLEPDPPPGLPLEFSHGAFRFGHAMVQDSYRLGPRPAKEFTITALLNETSADQPGRMPLRREWAVTWSRLFDLDAAEPPIPSRALTSVHSAQLGQPRNFPAIDQTEVGGTLYRDLMGAAFARLWPVGALADRIARERPALAAASPLLRDPRERARAIRAWLDRRALPPRFALDPEDAEAIAAAPPLPFYVLFEAETESGGERLGVLGSVIIAEVIYGALHRERMPQEIPGGTLADALRRLPQDFGLAADLTEFQGLASMPALIRALSAFDGWDAADPPFL